MWPDFNLLKFLIAFGLSRWIRVALNLDIEDGKGEMDVAKTVNRLAEIALHYAQAGKRLVVSTKWLEFEIAIMYLNAVFIGYDKLTLILRRSASYCTLGYVRRSYIGHQRNSSREWIFATSLRNVLRGQIRVYLLRTLSVNILFLMWLSPHYLLTNLLFCFYFRSAAGSGDGNTDRKSYQLPPGASGIAIRTAVRAPSINWFRLCYQE